MHIFFYFFFPVRIRIRYALRSFRCVGGGGDTAGSVPTLHRCKCIHAAVDTVKKRLTRYPYLPRSHYCDFKRVEK
jgi:hypothetical protein